MEEFKNIKEIIELCKEELDKNDENVNATLDFEDLKELQNLINKYKEQEKMIELMAKDIARNDFDEDICRTMKKDEFWCGSTDEECKNCVIEYYEKKAKGE